MRHFKTEGQNFSLNELLSLNAIGGEGDAANNLLKYLHCLERHGVVVRLARHAPGVALKSPGHVIWYLAFDLGWYAPFWKKNEKVLWNPNTCSAVPLPVAQGEAA